MAHKKVFTVPFRRKQEGKTDYKARLSLLKSGKLRLVVRKSNLHIIAQLIEYGDKGDKIIISASSTELKKYGWTKNTGNIPAAYLVGLLIAKKAGNKEAILDLGLQSPIKNTRLFAVLKGAIDGGLNINASETVFPTQDRLEGKHIDDGYGKEIETVKKNLLSKK